MTVHRRLQVYLTSRSGYALALARFMVEELLHGEKIMKNFDFLKILNFWKFVFLWKICVFCTINNVQPEFRKPAPVPVLITNCSVAFRQNALPQQTQLVTWSVRLPEISHMTALL